jgi:periplasmic divalent cation tolerance protein
MVEFIVVTTTTDTEMTAHAVARAMVESRLAACAQVGGPIVSHYWWQGGLRKSEEWRCDLKTRSALYGDLEAALRKIHPYETPQIVAKPLIAGSADYLEWLRRETSPQQA